MLMHASTGCHACQLLTDVVLLSPLRDIRAKYVIFLSMHIHIDCIAFIQSCEVFK